MMLHLGQDEWALIEKLLAAKGFALEGVTIDSNVYRHLELGLAIRFKIDFPLMKFDHRDVANGNTMSLIERDPEKHDDIRVVLARVYQLGRQTMPAFLRAPKARPDDVTIQFGEAKWLNLEKYIRGRGFDTVYTSPGGGLMVYRHYHTGQDIAFCTVVEAPVIKFETRQIHNKKLMKQVESNPTGYGDARAVLQRVYSMGGKAWPGYLNEPEVVEVIVNPLQGLW
ncbi:hypothetical protein [Dyella telluris]|uniref:Uncharacterized protein n=1 Tax=Dyella telluris TaxID=2763498 RepID=A0A7G8Q4K0_9GAMM|nr:hypothetical protein [Dyella telluris]QNK01708.1 hypothetical protein H8F01_00565 [Dyella telluris]